MPFTLLFAQVSYEYHYAEKGSKVCLVPASSLCTSVAAAFVSARASVLVHLRPLPDAAACLIFSRALLATAQHIVPGLVATTSRGVVLWAPFTEPSPALVGRLALSDGLGRFGARFPRCLRRAVALPGCAMDSGADFALGRHRVCLGSRSRGHYGLCCALTSRYGPPFIVSSIRQKSLQGSLTSYRRPRRPPDLSGCPLRSSRLS